MDKNAIKKYAIWARNELIDCVEQKALQYGIKKDDIVSQDAVVVNGRPLSDVEIDQRRKLISAIREKGYDEVIEEVAYTWFNRFAALRFMEVNGYIPSRIRVFTNEANEFKPQIITEAINLDIPEINMNKVYELKEKNNDEELYKYLIISQCNNLSKILPGMFEKSSDYTELLFPDNILRENSVIGRMISDIFIEDWKEEVQIIGWLYQFYNKEKKDKVFADLKKNIKISTENIPIATQLYTTDWIVRYMVENSLGRLWIERNNAQDNNGMAQSDNSALKGKWKYYLEEAEQEEIVKTQLHEIHQKYKSIEPKDIKCIDPCMGSGHILCYMFDVLMDIYESYGYTSREAVESIVSNNIYGLEIDKRAGQLAYFAVMMIARKYDSRFFTRNIQPHVYTIEESNDLDKDAIDEFVNGNADIKKNVDKLISLMKDAKTYGSLITVNNVDFELLYNRFDEVFDEFCLSREYISDTLLSFVRAAEVLSKQYDVVITNPPYMGSSGMNGNLSEFVKKNYPDSKSDTFAVFIEKCLSMVHKNGFIAMITQHAWMFLSSFEKLRKKLLNYDIINMAHLGARAFDEIGGEVVQTTSFVIGKEFINNYKGTYCRLIEPNTQQGKEDMFLAGKNRYISPQNNYEKIPGSPVAYWVSGNFINIFERSILLDKIADSKQGLATGCNDVFIRLWFECKIQNISFDCNSCEQSISLNKKWFPYNKGGDYRKWYGNNDYVVNWENDGILIRNFKNEKGKLRSRPQNTNYYFKECFSWSLISSSVAAFRFKPSGHIFDVAGMSCFSEKNLYYLLALCNTKVVMEVLKVIAPTINYQCGDIANIPIIFDESERTNIETIVDENISLCKIDWDAFETSWDFKCHPLVQAYYDKCSVLQGYYLNLIEDCYIQWETNCNLRFERLKYNEEELNRIFIDIYGLQDELTPEVEDKDVTVRKADLQREIKSLISYAVGCMFGRYSLDEEGLILAGQDFNTKFVYGSIPVTGTGFSGGDVSETETCFYKNKDGIFKSCTFAPDKDNIIPICDDEYFEDDIVGLFCKWLESAYGKDTLEQNLNFVADALGNKGSSSREVIRNYFINDFYKDHIKTYQKRPIYWLFDSGKKNGFKCLIYMHRYQPDTIARIRTDYVHKQQSRYRTAIENIETALAKASSTNRVKLNKQLTKLKDQAEETRQYEEKIHHLADRMISIDLDDGVKHNYEIFKDVLAKIK